MSIDVLRELAMESAHRGDRLEPVFQAAVLYRLTFESNDGEESVRMARAALFAAIDAAWKAGR
jgi:hypothetical protein